MVGASNVNASNPTHARRWSRTVETRQAFLEAARVVFTKEGFAEATVTEIVERADSSNGSLYHHFGGKSELFVALWEDHADRQEKRAATAVARARKSGETDPVELYIAGARAYLEGSWKRRDLVRLFHDGDAPPGFELLRRRRNREWLRQNSALLQAEDAPLDRVVVLILTTIIGETSREVASCKSEAEADVLIGKVMNFVRRLGPLHQ